jgi:hypothetical protein
MKGLMTDPKHAVDALSVGATLATLAGWLPHMAALASLVWSAIRIYETKTVQGWIGKRRKRK